MLGEIAELDVVAAPQLAALERPVPGERVDQGRLAGAVGADERDVLAALEPELPVLEQRPARDLQPSVVQLEHHAAAALGAAEAEAERALVARVALDAVDLVELLDPDLRLAALVAL